ncbi:RecQ family ATP-dependent DNA helicase [Macrococcoides caseolyticum]|uniref:RecQ family ATP-dependent DNA helicase n=1 Tax=Macrococcoides caseolyticum TaxID=69966 RepID=UPI001F203327|nr:RecQ family ATP-dependent DNA helicase [Macrococcus caseolyticus]MCE4957085.1 ATP-dependent DNA helicase RecQ [Macrococcus caseolyticus]
MSQLNNILNNVFHINHLRTNQVEIVNNILKGHDVLGLLPTGAGKSLAFQLPLLTLNKKTIVISPLIALMEDQVMQLKLKKISACCIHSQLDEEDKHMILSQLQRYDFIYCSPEWITTQGLNYLKAYPCEAIVVDEAHCISEWGYEFRPHYLLLREVIRHFNAQVIALTATANRKVLTDIEEVMERKFHIVDHITPRSNIYLSVIQAENDDEKLSFLKEHVQNFGPTIIYFSSKKQLEYVYQFLLDYQTIVERYHADMAYEDRMSVQQRFMNDEIQVICATNAFGMGINKPNIRTVIHYHMPKSIFQFTQEIGRGGRDGNLCQSILLYAQNDEYLSYRLNEMNELTLEEIDMYFEGMRLSEDKVILMDILSAYYEQQEIKLKIKHHQQSKRNSTLKMIDYIQTRGCYFKNLYEEDSENNKTEETKCCRHCDGLDYLQFEKMNYSIHKKFNKTLLNQLFNGLYDFT